MNNALYPYVEIIFISIPLSPKATIAKQSSGAVLGLRTLLCKPLHEDTVVKRDKKRDGWMGDETETNDEQQRICA